MRDAALQPQAASCREGYKRPGKSHFKNQKVPDPHLKKKKKNHCRPGTDPGSDGGHLLTGEAKKSTGVLAAGRAPGASVRTASCMAGPSCSGAPGRCIPRETDANREDTDTQGGSRWRENYVH